MSAATIQCAYCDLYNGVYAAKKHGRWVEELPPYFEVGPDNTKMGRRCYFPAVYLDESGRVIS